MEGINGPKLTVIPHSLPSEKISISYTINLVRLLLHLLFHLTFLTTLWGRIYSVYFACREAKALWILVFSNREMSIIIGLVLLAYIGTQITQLPRPFQSDAHYERFLIAVRCMRKETVQSFHFTAVCGETFIFELQQGCVVRCLTQERQWAWKEQQSLYTSAEA